MYNHTNNYSRNKKNNEIKKQLKFIISIVTIVILMAIMLISLYNKDSQAVQYRTITVEKGDTLWQIATSSNEQNQDPRQLVYTIKKINNLETLLIQPGEKLKIPF